MESNEYQIVGKMVVDFFAIFNYFRDRSGLPRYSLRAVSFSLLQIRGKDAEEIQVRCPGGRGTLCGV